MIKKFIIPIVIFLCVLIAVFVYMLTQKPLPMLAVVTTSPINTTIHNPFLPVIITFNRTIQRGEVSAVVSPKTDVSFTVADNMLTITPKAAFLPEVSYTIRLNTDPPFVFSFTTETTLENHPGYNEAMKASVDAYEKEYGVQNAALADIRKNSPVAGDGFVITYSYKNNTYTVKLDAPADQNKAKFQSWLTQKDITKLENLRIVYVSL